MYDVDVMSGFPNRGSLVFEKIVELLPPVLMLIAAGLSVAAGIGLLRFPDVLTQLHAATKPQVFGVLLTVAAIAIDQQSITTLLALLPVFAFQALTAPISAHMVGRASYRTGKFSTANLIVDELEPAIERARENDNQEGAL